MTQDTVPALIKNIRANFKAAKKFLDKNQLGMADGFYRYYHQSFKTFYSQGYTYEMVEFFKSLDPKEVAGLNEDFMAIIKDGTEKEFDYAFNSKWRKSVSPVIEAMLHAKFFMELIYVVGRRWEKNDVKDITLLSYDEAAVLYLFNLR